MARSRTFAGAAGVIGRIFWTPEETARETNPAAAHASTPSGGFEAGDVRPVRGGNASIPALAAGLGISSDSLATARPARCPPRASGAAPPAARRESHVRQRFPTLGVPCSPSPPRVGYCAPTGWATPGHAAWPRPAPRGRGDHRADRRCPRPQPGGTADGRGEAVRLPPAAGPLHGRWPRAAPTQREGRSHLAVRLGDDWPAHSAPALNAIQQALCPRPPPISPRRRRDRPHEQARRLPWQRHG